MHDTVFEPLYHNNTPVPSNVYNIMIPCMSAKRSTKVMYRHNHLSWSSPETYKNVTLPECSLRSTRLQKVYEVYHGMEFFLYKTSINGLCTKEKIAGQDTLEYVPTMLSIGGTLRRPTRDHGCGLIP